MVKSTKTNSDIYYQLLSSNLKYVLEHLSDLSPHTYLFSCLKSEYSVNTQQVYDAGGIGESDIKLFVYCYL